MKEYDLTISQNIVFPDADIKKAVEWSVWGINMNFGQTCHAGTRIYVHEDVYDEFIAAYTARLKKMTVGDNFDEKNDQGPQNSKMQFDKILGKSKKRTASHHPFIHSFIHSPIRSCKPLSWTSELTQLNTGYIESGKSEGATLHLGGNIHKSAQGEGTGYFIEPTIFTDVKPNMKIMREEIFGPVVAIAKFKTEEEVIELANDTTYGLAAGIHTKDYERAIRVTSQLEAGTTWVNMYNFVHWSIPFGGYKQSGIGRECGEVALENYTETKAVYFNMGMTAPDALPDDQ